MADLATHAEVGRLRSELGVDDDSLDFLLRYGHDDVRALRWTLTDALGAGHRRAFDRIASASGLVPAPIAATIARRAFGPLLCSKIAAELDPPQARRLVGHLEVPFLADLCRTLDAHRAGPVIRAIPTRRAVAVGTELYRRRDVETLARFVDVVADDVFAPMLSVIDDDELLLRVGIAAESRTRLDAVFASLPDERILGIVDAAVRADLLPAAVALVAELGPEQAGRAIRVVVDAGELLLTDLVATISRLGGWDELLPVVVALDPDHLTALASSPALDRPELFRAVAEDVIEAGLGPELVALVATMSPRRQEDLASTLATGAPGVARELLALVGRVEGASDLPAVTALAAVVDTAPGDASG